MKIILVQFYILSITVLFADYLKDEVRIIVFAIITAMFILAMFLDGSK